MKYLLSSALVVAVALSSLSAQREEVTVIGPGGVRAAVTALIPEFERRTGHKVKATFGSGGGTKQQVVKGEPFDVPIVQPPLAEVIASGQVVASSETPLATVPVVLAVKKGERKPDISTPDAIKKLFLAAKSVSFPNPAGGAAAGVSIMAMLEKLGIADVVKAKAKYGQLNLVAMDEAEIGLTFQSEIDEPGIDVVGTMPRELLPPTALVGFVSSHAKNPAAAKAFLEFLASPEAAATYRKLGMQPGR